MVVKWCTPMIPPMVHLVLEADVPGELDVVGEDAVVADPDVVGDVHADQEAVVRADVGDAAGDLGAAWT